MVWEKNLLDIQTFFILIKGENKLQGKLGWLYILAIKV